MPVKRGDSPTQWELAPDVLTVREAAALLAVDRSTVYDLMARPGFPVVRLGPKSARILRDRLRGWIEGGMRGA